MDRDCQIQVAVPAVHGHRTGVDIMRVWFSFGVVLAHFWHEPFGSDVVMDIFARSTQLRMATFMFVSFLLTGPSLCDTSVNRDKIVRRLWRLALPIVMWAVIYFAVLWVAHGGMPVSSLWWQLFTGHSYNKAMWFLNNILYLTLLFAPILLMHDRILKTAIFAVLTVVPLALEYTGAEQALIDGLRDEIKYPLGRLVEMMPYVSLPLLLCVTGVMSRLRDNPLRGLVLLLPAAAVAYIWLAPGWSGVYALTAGGLPLLIKTMMVSLMIYFLPGRIIPAVLRRMLAAVARYGMGIYCVLLLVGHVFFDTMAGAVGLRPGSFSGCVALYIVSLALCVAISRIPSRLCRNIVM